MDNEQFAFRPDKYDIWAIRCLFHRTVDDTIVPDAVKFSCHPYYDTDDYLYLMQTTLTTVWFTTEGGLNDRPVPSEYLKENGEARKKHEDRMQEIFDRYFTPEGVIKDTLAQMSLVEMVHRFIYSIKLD